jgi:hypothetical protein
MAAAGEAAAAPAVLAVATLCCEGWKFYGTARAMVPVPAGAPLTMEIGAETPSGAIVTNLITMLCDGVSIGTLRLSQSSAVFALLAEDEACIEWEMTCNGLNNDGQGHALTARVLLAPGASAPSFRLRVRLVCFAAHNLPTPKVLSAHELVRMVKAFSPGPSPDGGVHLAAGADGVAWARANPPSALFAANPDAGAAPVRYLHAAAPGAAALPLRGGHWCATARGRMAAAAHISRARPCLLQVVCLSAAGRAGPRVDGRGGGAGSGRLGHCRPHRAVR